MPSTRPAPPRSCDTFVGLAPATADGSVIFGKNSDREQEEVQEVVAFAGSEHPPGTMLRCTYIAIPQAPRTLAVVLSKPSWMWGAEMGANEAGVVCGNEAVWSLEESDGPPALLGMDLVRLALERGATAAEALDVVTALLAEHGQGGPCEEGGSWTYHNSFLLADWREAWVLETAGRHWAAQRIAKGHRNISNCLSIRTAFDRCSRGLHQHARARGLWDGSAQLDFAAAFSEGGAPPAGELTPGREEEGHRLLQTAAGSLDPAGMMRILRDGGSGVCMCSGGFRTNGAQVSRLARPAAGGSAGAPPAAQHWFTATPDPQRSVFKPFSFPRLPDSCRQDSANGDSSGGSGGRTPSASPLTAAAPAPRNPPHQLWRAWQGAYERKGGRRPAAAALRELEARGLDAAGGLTFAAAVEQEMELYRAQQPPGCPDRLS